MKKLFLVIALLGLLLPDAVQAQTSAPVLTYDSFPGDPLNTRHYVLANGLTVYLSVNPREPRVQTRVTVRTGSRNDPADNTGLAHYLEHLLFKGNPNFGTKNYEREKPLLNQITGLYELYKQTTDTNLRKEIYYRIDSISYKASQIAIANEYDKMMQILGAQGTNAYTSFDETVYLNNIPSNQIYKWLEIEADRYINPVFRLFHTELEAVYEEKNRSLDNDDSKAFEMLFRGLFPGHPYGTQTTIGTVEHLKNPSIKAIENYFRQWYVPSNMAIILCGDFDPDSVIQAINKNFSRWIPREKPEQRHASIAPRKEFTEHTVLGPNPAYVMFGYRIPSGRVRERAHAMVVNQLLYNGKAGKLDINLNLAQKVQSAYSFDYPLNETGAHIFVGVPREGQTLPEVKQLIIQEIEKIKRGEFDEKELQAIVDNKELEYEQSYLNNSARASEISEAFVLGYSWKDYQDIRLAYRQLTKQEIVDFANKNYTDDLITIYKEEGIDTSIAKIEKPKITPIELNKGLESEWLKKQVYQEVAPVKPRFIDFTKDLTRLKTKSGLDFFYTHNADNSQFSLYYILDMGSLNDLKLAYAIDLLPYLGTTKYGVEELNKKFYELAANFGVSAGSDRTYVYLTGLEKNFDATLELFEHLLHNAVPNQDALDNLVASTLKDREDAKKDKGSILYGAMLNYTLYGKDNPFTYQLKEAELKSLKAEDLVNSLNNLLTYEHYVYYHGPQKSEDILNVINEKHLVPGVLKAYPAKKEFKFAKAPKKDQVYFVHFDMVQAEILWLRNSGAYNESQVPVSRLFNEYFDGGMGTVVFQELRESKALAYSTYARFVTASRPQDPNYVMAYIGTQSDKLMDAVPAMNKLFNTPPSQEKALRTARESLRQSIETNRTLDESVFFAYLAAKRMGRDYDINQKVYEQLDLINLPLLAEFQQTYFGSQTYYYCIIGSKDKISTSDLKKIGKVKVLRLEEIFGY